MLKKKQAYTVGILGATGAGPPVPRFEGATWLAARPPGAAGARHPGLAAAPGPGG